MGLSTKNGISLYTVDGFCEDGRVGHCFTTRYGGVSGDSGRLLNMSFTKEPDKPANVIENVRRVAAACGFDCSRVTTALQVHGDNIVRVTEEIAGARFSKPETEIVADGLITDIPGVVLMTTHGDCLPVYLYDAKGAIGLVHSGWRGAVERIAGKAVARMTQEFGTDPGNITAALGPCICGDCFIVDPPVAELFEDAFPDVGIMKDAGFSGKYTVDLEKAVRIALIEAGVPEDNIFISGECTAAPQNAEIYFSHRREKGTNQGLMGAFMWLETAPPWE